MLPFHKGDRIATTAGGDRSASRQQSKALWELSPLTRGTGRNRSGAISGHVKPNHGKPNRGKCR